MLIDHQSRFIKYAGAQSDPRARQYLPARRIVTMSSGELQPENSTIFIDNNIVQAYIHPRPTVCVMKPGASMVLDFGMELNGGVRIVTGGNDCKVNRIQINFGESVSEALQHPNNDHAIHETTLDIAPMAHNEIGNTGFRFVRIEIPADAPRAVEIINVIAVALFRNLEYAGDFRCSDDRLTEIWQTGAYTVHLNMQDFLYDGIKRDRLVWMGDMNPEIRVICAAFNDTDCVEKSLDFAREHATLPNFMNGISAYSLWWIISQYDWYMRRGNRKFLEKQQEYLVGLLRVLSEHVNADGVEKLPSWRFLDWPSNGHNEAVHAGLQGLMAWAFSAGEKLTRILGDTATADLCADVTRRLRKHNPDGGNSKQANAVKVLGGLADAATVNQQVLSRDPFTGLSTFFGYYVMEARAAAGDFTGAVEAIRHYWGGMLDAGATTFWEDFELRWLENAGRIDEIPAPGKKDIHADYGNFCYKSLRHSLCHGWAGGPTAWLSDHLLGVKPLEPGFRVAEVKPQLAGLDWVEGKVPTPFGPICVRAEKGADGKMKVTVEKPQEITIR